MEVLDGSDLDGPDLDGADDGRIIDDWSRAEETLYGSLMADPALYQSAVAVIGVVTTHLRAHVADGAGLLAAYRRGPDLVASVAPDMVTWASPQRVLAAACAIRYRELLADQGRSRIFDAVLAAHADGDRWATIEPEQGSRPYPAMTFGGGMLDGRTLNGRTLNGTTRVHVGSGLGLTCSVEMDLETGAPRWVTRPIAVDVANGAMGERPAPLGEDRVAASPEAQRADVEALMALVESVVERQNRLL